MSATAGRAGAGLIVLICFLIAVLEGYDIQAFGIAAPKLVKELGLDAGQQGWAASIAMIGLVIGAFAGGWIADRIGRKPVLLAATFTFGLFSIATALSHRYDLLLAARLATGLGFGGAMPNLIAIATEISRPERRTATVTTIFCGMPAGGAAVSLLARMAGDGLDWRMLFFIGGALPLLITPLVYFLLPETRPQHQPDADRRLLNALFNHGRAAPTLLLWLVFMLTLVVLYLMLNWLPTLVIAKGLTAADGSSAALSFNVSAVIGCLLLGLVVDRAGFRWPLTLTFVALAAAMLALGGAMTLNPILILSAAAGFLVVGAQFSLYGLAPLLYPPQVRASGAGAAVAMGRIGSIVGPLIGGELRQAGYGAGQVFGFMAPVVIVAAAAMLTLSFLARPHQD